MVSVMLLTIDGTDDVRDDPHGVGVLKVGLGANDQPRAVKREGTISQGMIGGRFDQSVDLQW